MYPIKHYVPIGIRYCIVINNTLTIDMAYCIVPVTGSNAIKKCDKSQIKNSQG